MSNLTKQYSPQGQFFSGSTHRVYLLGNPVVWWGNLAFLVIFFVVYVINSIREKRAEAIGSPLKGELKGYVNISCPCHFGAIRVRR